MLIVSQGNHRVNKGTFIFTRVFQLINAEQMIECHTFIVLNETVQLGKDIQYLLTSQKKKQRQVDLCFLMACTTYNITYEVFL